MVLLQRSNVQEGQPTWKEKVVVKPSGARKRVANSSFLITPDTRTAFAPIPETLAGARPSGIGLVIDAWSLIQKVASSSSQFAECTPSYSRPTGEQSAAFCRLHPDCFEPEATSAVLDSFNGRGPPRTAAEGFTHSIPDTQLSQVCGFADPGAETSQNLDN